MESTSTENGWKPVADSEGVFDFEQRFQEQSERLKAKIGNMVGNIHDAEDILQETAFRGWKSEGDLRGKDKFAGWIFRIAVNVAHTFCRKRTSREKVLTRFRITEASDRNILSGPDDDPQQCCRTNEIISSLPDDCRDIYVDRFVKGFTNAELSERYDLHENTIRNRLKKAKRILDEKFPDPDQ